MKHPFKALVPLLAIVALAILGKITDALVGLFERWVKAKYPSN